MSSKTRPKTASKPDASERRLYRRLARNLKRPIRPTGIKRTFDLGRDSIYVADPIADLRICGAKGVVPADESGDLDTPPGPDVPIRDTRRLSQPLRGIKASVDRRGLTRPVVIVKIGEVANVIDGKSGVRAARASNRARRKDGRPLLKIRCVIQRDASPVAILGTMIALNNNRTEDTLTDRVEKLVEFLGDGAGPSEADAAIEFGVSVDRIRDWVDFADRAIQDVKEAAAEGKISASAALEIAKIRDADAQRAALAKILSGATAGDRSARAARALARGVNGTPTVTDRKSQRLLLAYLTSGGSAPGSPRESARADTPPGGSAHGYPRDPGPPGGSAPGYPRDPGSETDAEFWRGVVEALKAVTGQEADPRVTQAIAAARAPKD